MSITKLTTLDIETDGGLAEAGVFLPLTAELVAVGDQTYQPYDGIHPLQIVVATFDMAVVGNRTVAAHGLGVTIPAHGCIVGGVLDVNTLFTSDNANNGTITLGVETAVDVLASAPVSGAPYSSIGRKAIIPKALTPEAVTCIKTTAAREITATVGTSAMLTGKFTIYLWLVCGKASA